MRSHLPKVAVLVLWLLSGIAASAREPWSDQRLPDIAGLQVWLDASRLAGDQQAADSIAVWKDGSGHTRDVLQPNTKAQPKRVMIGDTTLVRFDGQDDHFTAAGCDTEFAEMTVLIVGQAFDNPGGFRAFLATNRDGVNDYVSGITIDQSGGPTNRFEVINPEGIGFGGARDVMSDAFDFGTSHLVTVVCQKSPGQVQVYVDGKFHGQRERNGGPIRMDRLTVGARFYGHGMPPQVTGFLEGDIAEVLIFDRALSDPARVVVEKYLRDKYERLLKTRVDRPGSSGSGHRLISVPCPPVQMFVPGFEARELPIELRNVNNLRYRADGKLVAVAYNGDIHLLTDTDGDGLEDRSDLFWESRGRLRSPIGAALTPPQFPLGQGVFVPSKGKVSLILDRDGDDRADDEIVLASGWKELPHGVDALGVAVDPRDGSIFYGMGTTDYTQPYLIDRDGKAQYELTSERGTIMRILPDLKSREIYCTGIRFPVGLAFNGNGDLFCTDQEGATWVPNGNPLDELLHIQRGRHYGFPPRHPQHLPGVIDEPSTFDYTPQHQSTCGLQFNEPVNGGPVFGLELWRGDALVAGYSRGKLYRTKLVKTDVGYVAQSQLFGVLSMLTVDMCLSPQGDLVVAAHSGGPDWGSGPGGHGKLYKIRFASPDVPQPVHAWAAGPQEVCVTFDRPLDPQMLVGLKSRLHIEYGEAVAAGDRFEALRPGYEIVHRQQNQPRFDLPIYSVQVTPDRRTLVLSTGPHPYAAGYAITIASDGVARSLPDATTTSDAAGAASKTGKDDAVVALETVAPGKLLPQFPEVDLAYDVCGVVAEWSSADGQITWSGWLPHIDSHVCRELTQHSVEHGRLRELLAQPGKLVLRTQLRLENMLRPAVQPGSTITYQWPEETVTLVINSRQRGTLRTPTSEAHTTGGQLRWETNAKSLAPLELSLETGPDFAVGVSWFTNEDQRVRPLPLHRFLLPWATLPGETQSTNTRARPPELAGGSWSRGWKIFFDPQIGCAKCHTAHGLGGKIGPDLTNVVHRDYASVLRDIEQPSFAINPDFITQTLVLKDGRMLSGVVRSEAGKLLVGNERGELTTIAQADIEELHPAAISTMPKDQAKQLGPDRLRDVLTFLLTPPPRMPEYARGEIPPPRTRSEVAAILNGSTENSSQERLLRIGLVAGPKDHGPGEHDYPAWLAAWGELLACANQVEVSAATPWPSPEQLERSDVLVFFQQGKWSDEKARQIDAFLKRGGGLVYIHYAVDGGPDSAGFAERIGLAWRGGQSRFRHGPLDLEFNRGSQHPVARNFDRVHFHDESYWRLVGEPQRIQLLASGLEDGEPQPLFWTTESQGGRVFVSILGHYSWTFDDPLFRILLLRGMAWTARESVDRLNNLATIGARIE